MEKLKPNFKTYPQTNRLFVLNKIAIERCKAEFSEHYHFKQMQAKEHEELTDRQKMGLALLNELKLKGITLTSEQNTQFKAFRNGARYLIKQLEETALHVANVDTGEFTPTPYKPITHSKDNKEGNQND